VLFRSRYVEKDNYIVPSTPESLTFSPDGKRLAYGAKNGDKQLVVVDGQEISEHDDATSLMGPFYLPEPIFSFDGKKLAYEIKKNVKYFVVLDGRAGPEYDQIVCGPVFLKDGTLEYITKKNNSLYRIQHK
jgi:hypothetical protein